MGGSGGGGGSAGEVSWPADVQDRYNHLVGDTSTAITDTFEALAGAQGSNPYVGAGGYNPEWETAQIETAYNNLETFIGEFSPLSTWGPDIIAAWSRYLQIIGELPIFQPPTPIAVQEIFNIWTLVEPALTAAQDIFDIWTLVEPVVTAVDDISGSWVDPTFNAPDDIKADVAAEDNIDAATAAFGAALSDNLNAEALPRFEAGMRDINAVQSSAFVIGRAIIEGMYNRDVAKFDADMRFKAFLQRDNLLGQAHMQIDKMNAENTAEKNKVLSQAYLEQQKILSEEAFLGNKLRSQALLDRQKILAEEVAEGNKLRSQALIQADKLNADSDKAASLINAEMARHGTTMAYQDADGYYKHMETSLDLYKTWAGFVIDASRMIYVMHKEQHDKEVDYDAVAARWDLDMVQIAGNLIASISGGTSYTAAPNLAQNALGGAFAGASIGARATGNAYGAGAGAILGGIGAYLLGR